MAGRSPGAGDARLPGDGIGTAPHGSLKRPTEQPDDAAEQRQLDFLADAGRAGMRKRCKRATEGEDRAGFISDGRDAGAHRLSRRGVGLRDAAERLRHGVGAGKVCMRPLGAVARDRDVDELGVDFSQFFVAEAVLRGGARTEVLPEDIGLSDELLQDLAAFARLQVQSDALHAAVVRFEETARHARQYRHRARVVTARRRFDLDHLGAEISHQHVGNCARLGRRAGHDSYALQGTMRLAHVNVLL
jgi:hypothetical protein